MMLDPEAARLDQHCLDKVLARVAQQVLPWACSDHLRMRGRHQACRLRDHLVERSHLMIGLDQAPQAGCLVGRGQRGRSYWVTAPGAL